MSSDRKRQKKDETLVFKGVWSEIKIVSTQFY